MIGNVRPAPGAVRRGRGGLVRFCAHLCGLVRWGAPNGRIDADAGQAAFRRAKPPDRRNHPRGNRAAPYLPAVAGRAGQAQPVDPGKSAGRPAAVHARDHGAAGAGARRVLAQVASGVRADPCQRRCRPRRSRRLFAPRGHAGSRGPTSPSGPRSATRRRSTPIAPRSRGTRPHRRLLFREGERLDAAFSQFGEVAVPNQSGFIYLVTNRHGQHRLITVSRPTITGEMYGIITTLLAGRGSQLTPIAAPIALLPVQNIANPSVGRVMSGDAELCSLSRAPAPHDRRAVRAVHAGVGMSSRRNPGTTCCLLS